MEALYHQTNALIQDTQHYFEQLSRLVNSDPKSANLIEKLWSNIDVLLRNCDRLDILVQKEPMTTRSRSKVRVNQLKYDISHLQAALKNYHDEKIRSKIEEDERNQLLSRRFTHNSKNPTDTTILIDHSINHHNSLQNANRGLDDMLNSGAGILENLRNQRSTLRNAKRRLMDIVSNLGLSNTTMRLIERRAREDKFIFYGGIILTLLVIFIVIIYFA